MSSAAWGDPNDTDGTIADEPASMKAAAAARVPQLSAGGGMPYRGLVSLARAAIGVPTAGLSRPPTSYRPERHAASLATHLVSA